MYETRNETTQIHPYAGHDALPWGVTAFGSLRSTASLMIAWTRIGRPHVGSIISQSSRLHAAGADEPHAGGAAKAESAEFPGRSIAALAADENVLEKSGKVFITPALAHEYGFTDIDGRQQSPFWARHWAGTWG